MAMNGEDLYRAVLSEGGHLASSKQTDGAFRGAVLDNSTNVLKGQAEFIKVDVNDAESAEGVMPLLLAATAGGAVTLLVVKVVPRVKRWWVERRPTIEGHAEPARDEQAVVVSLVPPAELEPSETVLDEAESG